jgi:hypothetical protein
MYPSALFIGGSVNQTSIMHQIAKCLPNFDCRFSPFYATGLPGIMADQGMLDFSILGGNHRQESEKYLRKHHLPMDFGGKNGPYDLVFLGTDLIVPQNIRQSKVILVQEGITEPECWSFEIARRVRPLRFIANTAATGLSDAYDTFCIASEGYRDLFISKGVNPKKIRVSGIPNFDNAAKYTNNNFPYKHFVLAATSSIRETLGSDDRIEFLIRTKTIAANRPLIFKLHPNENQKRAAQEIRSVFPDALIYHDGNLHEMIANCDVFICQKTSAVYTALSLGKEVHAYHSLAELKRLNPIQNGGTSAMRIANIGKELLQTQLKPSKLHLTASIINRKSTKPTPKTAVH